MQKLRLATLATIAAATAATMAGLAGPVDAAGTRFQCRDELARQDVSATARFEQSGSRRKFTVEVEAAVGSSFRAGDVLRVRIDDAAGVARAVGQVRLARRAQDLVGDLNFDTVRQPDSRPFPANFPRRVGPGTEVQVGAQLACALQRR